MGLGLRLGLELGVGEREMGYLSLVGGGKRGKGGFESLSLLMFPLPVGKITCCACHSRQKMYSPDFFLAFLSFFSDQ